MKFRLIIQTLPHGLFPSKSLVSHCNGNIVFREKINFFRVICFGHFLILISNMFSSRRLDYLDMDVSADSDVEVEVGVDG